jgi:hypothetical protein
MAAPAGTTFCTKCGAAVPTEKSAVEHVREKYDDDFSPFRA